MTPWPRAAGLLLLAAGALAIVIRNGAPCLEGRKAVTSEDTLKDDWACFVFCGPVGTFRPDECSTCCLDPDAPLDPSGPADETTDRASSTTPGRGGGKRTTEAGGGGGASTEAAEASSEKAESSSEGGATTEEGGGAGGE